MNLVLLAESLLAANTLQHSNILQHSNTLQHNYTDILAGITLNLQLFPFLVAIPHTRDGRFGSKVGRIGPKWDKSVAFQIRFQCIWRTGAFLKSTNQTYRSVNIKSSDITYCRYYFFKNYCLQIDILYFIFQILLL